MRAKLQPAWPRPSSKPPMNSRMEAFWTGTLCGLLVAAPLVVKHLGDEQPELSEPETTMGDPIADLEEQERKLIDLYARVNPSVVNITTYQDFNNEVVASSQGSGFVYDPNGYIVTNAHVVHGSDQIDVSFADGMVVSADVIGEEVEAPEHQQPLVADPQQVGDRRTLRGNPVHQVAVPGGG